MDEDDMTVPAQQQHPIGVVAERTGLSLDVLRVWERRYGVVDPVRDDAGRRLYSDADIERLRLLALATSAGRSIGQIAALPIEQLRELVRGEEAARWTAARTPAWGGEPAAFVEDALRHVRALDGAAVEHVLRRAAGLLGAPIFLEEVIAVLTRRIGDEWHAGRLNIAQEHLASGVIAPLLAQLRAALPVAAGAPRLLVATPAGERHELGALMVAAAASAEGWLVTYLGSDMPAADIAAAALETEARAVALSSVYTTDEEALVRELRSLRGLMPGDVALLVGGGGAARMALADDLAVVKMSDLTGLRSYLRDGAFGNGTGA
jgi:MerR family transcriptional regulator, light-induced transcriptional regulator